MKKPVGFESGQIQMKSWLCGVGQVAYLAKQHLDFLAVGVAVINDSPQEMIALSISHLTATCCFL